MPVEPARARRPVGLGGRAVIAAIVLLATAAWIVMLRVTGIGMDLGLAGGATIVFVPLLLGAATLLWFAARAALLYWRGGISIGTATAGGGVLALIAMIGYCGPSACLGGAGASLYSGWFVIGGTMLAAFAYEAMARRT